MKCFSSIAGRLVGSGLVVFCWSVSCGRGFFCDSVINVPPVRAALKLPHMLCVRLLLCYLHCTLLFILLPGLTEALLFTGPQHRGDRLTHGIRS